MKAAFWTELEGIKGWGWRSHVSIYTKKLHQVMLTSDNILLIQISTVYILLPHCAPAVTQTMYPDAIQLFIRHVIPGWRNDRSPDQQCFFATRTWRSWCVADKSTCKTCTGRGWQDTKLSSHLLTWCTCLQHEHQYNKNRTEMESWEAICCAAITDYPTL